MTDKPDANEQHERHEADDDRPEEREEREAKSPRRTASKTRTRPKPAPPKPRQLPPWKVILHNDEENYAHDVVAAIVLVTPLVETEAQRKTVEAHTTGSSLLLTTHRERAELYVQQFGRLNLTVTIEPA